MTEQTGAIPTPEDLIQVALGASTTPFDGTPLADLAAAMNHPSRTPLAPGHVITEIPGRGGIIAPGTATCHRCGTLATAQWQRKATPAEAETHWDAQERNIRESGTPEYVADRSSTVTMAVHGCDEHVVDAPHLTHDADCDGHGACECEAHDA